MTERELQRLRPKDLVMLLLQQTSEILLLYERVEKKKEELLAVTKQNEDLKAALNESDEKTEVLKRNLDDIDFQIRDLEIEKKLMLNDQHIPIEKFGSLTDAACKLNEIFESTQRKVERYLRNGKEDDPPETESGKTDGEESSDEEKPSDQEQPETGRKISVIPGTEPYILDLVRDGVLQLEPEDDSHRRSMLEELKKRKKSQSADQDGA